MTFAGGSGTGDVNFTVTGKGCSLFHGINLKATVAGTCIVTATQNASPGYLEATSAPTTFTFSAAPDAQATLSVSNTVLTSVDGEEFTLTTTGGSGTGDVTFPVTGPGCSVSGTRLNANTLPATCIVTAKKAASTGYLEATSETKTFTFPAAVSFDANGGSGSMTSQSASKATALTLNAGAITRSGYTFNGWNTSANGNGTAYADNASYPFTASTTLYATWGCLPLTVTASAERLTEDRAKVRWTASSSESPWTTFMVTTVGGGWPTTVSQSSDTGSKTVTGLMPFQSYTFTVKATNEAGCSYTSAQTNRVAAVS